MAFHYNGNDGRMNNIQNSRLFFNKASTNPFLILIFIILLGIAQIGTVIKSIFVTIE